MEKIAWQGLLYDFYGELLTEHQRQIYEDVVYNDMSLGEIADIQGISRQGVHDLLKRCDKILEGYEQKLHLVERFGLIKDKVSKINMLTGQMEATREDGIEVWSDKQIEQICEIRMLSNEILGEL